MPKRRQQGGSRRGRSASVAADTPGTQLCSACSCDVGDDAIGCDECEAWVHGTVTCPKKTKVLKVIIYVSVSHYLRPGEEACKKLGI